MAGTGARVVLNGTGDSEVWKGTGAGVVRIWSLDYFEDRNAHALCSLEVVMELRNIFQMHTFFKNKLTLFRNFQH